MLRRAIATVLSRDLSDPRLEGMISVTRVNVSPDHRTAAVHVSVAPEKHGRRALGGLKHAAGRIQSLLRDHVRMRQVPRLEFKLDESIKKEAEVFKAIAEGMAREAERGEQGEQDGQTSSPPLEKEPGH